ncbi:oxidoreductase, aldo/keto reductase family protein [Bacteriovorax sp. BSW11_IV]|uniref:aldo/keto reductase n=1 Tax=Bacteriovorax sp. BSW11_IV TaxID=1353529 RepID=UPI000389DDBC|nr:aldo/keto reductase [Bacteriovorax sp. BSW11_IV]EQC49164.1 oxidoreductase, aldo/keto reductase family protein [Bacteriovorax sp. BSW11_IV]
MGILRDWSPIPLGFGGASISGEGGGYGFGEISQSNAISLLEESFDSGIRVFDTAPIYGFGESEKRIGLAFKKNREKVKIISKCGVTWHDNRRVNMTNDPATAKKMIEESLRTLDSEYIDLYMIHWPDKNVDIRKTMEVLSRAKDEGKIHHIGLCNTNVEECEKAFEVDKIEAVQSELNFFNRDVVTQIFPYLKDKNIDFMSWGTLDKGILTGRVHEKRTFDKSDCRSWAPWWKSQKKDQKYQLAQRLKTIGEEQGFSLLEMALSHNLRYEEVSLVLCGARNSEQLQQLLKSINNLPAKELIEFAALECEI